MKLNSFKFQDGKVFWLLEYPERIDHACTQLPDHDCPICSVYTQDAFNSLASAIEVAPEDVGKVKKNIFMQNPEVRKALSIYHPGQLENGKVYSVECEIETCYQWKTLGGWVNVVKKVYDEWSKESSDNGRQVARLKYTATNDPSKTTEQERLVLMSLQEAHNIFIRLPIQHNDDVRDWADTIHRAQQIVMSRIAVRCNPEMFTNISK